MIDELIKELKKQKIKDYEIFYSENETVSLATNKTNFSKKEADIDKGCGLRIYKNNKIGFSYVSDKKHIPNAINTAVSISKTRPKMKKFQFYNKNPKMKVKTYDQKVINLDENSIKDLIKGMLNNITTTPISCTIGKNISFVNIINSEGLNCSQKETSFIASSYCASNNKTGHEYYESYKLDEKQILETAKTASKHSKEKVKRINACKLPVIIQGEALMNIIDNLILTQITGDKKRFKSSYLIGKENTKIAPNNFTLYEDPFSEAYSKTNFDGEGVEDDISILIDKGVFKGFVYDKETSALENKKIFGFCSRSNYKQFPIIGFSNIHIKPGKTKNLENIYKEYLVIDDVFGFHTANPTTGDFSLTIDRAYKVKNNKKEFIQGNILSGNTYELLKNIEDIESSIKMKGSFILPRILVKGLTIS